jgi:DNA replication protein DnaC
MTASSNAAASAAIGAATRALRLPIVRSEAGRLAEEADRSHATHLAYLAEVLTVEVDERTERRRRRLVIEARFPRLKRIGDFDFSLAPPGTDAVVAALAQGSYLEKGEPVVFLGDSGTGKSHLLIALGLLATEAGKRVRYATAAGLVNELVEAQDDRRLARLVARLGRLDLLLVDELGYVALDGRGAELLFQVITEREERASIATASNLPFSEWGQIIADPRLVAAIVDRLTFNGHIVETGSNSYRLRATRSRRKG